ncbi:MAG: inner membrane protein [Saprospiraceae bacterium]|jgi:inner membrane protein
MATILTHPAVPLALGLGLGKQLIPTRLMLLGMLLSVLPDLDVAMLMLGVPWSSVYAHRGFSHSISFALLISGLILFYWQGQNTRGNKGEPLMVFVFCFVVLLSHTFLDALTWGGQGVALLWPFDHARFRFDYRPIPASPLSVSGFMRWGGFVLLSELKLIWLPLCAFTASLWAARKWLVPKLLNQ